LTARVELEDLPPGQRIHYRVSFQDLADLTRWSEPVEGSFTSVPSDARDVTLAWSGCCVGQGWGIDESRGGLRIFDTLRRVQPHAFLHLGDFVYADQPLLPEVKLDDGTVWRNVVTPEKRKVAETLDEFRGNYLYPLLDPQTRAFNAEVPLIATWDDHEVMNNWHDGFSIADDARYREKSVPLLAARGHRAFVEHVPLRREGPEDGRLYRVSHWGPLLDIVTLDLRSYRSPNSANRQAAGDETARLMGPAQLAWLKAVLRRSQATWKLIMSSLPISAVVTDWPDRGSFESWSNADAGAPLGREHEIAELLTFLHQERVANVVFVSSDLHYCTAIHYHPDRARLRPFTPFWELIAGPMHAGTFGPNPIDSTFGPEVRFVGIPPGMKPNRPPSDGLQFFGTLRIDGRTGVMTVKLHNVAGESLWTAHLEPVRAGARSR
jgi:alkaline phosphatase D